MEQKKWPKVFSPFTPEQAAINTDFLKHWHELLASRSRYSIIEKFNHGYIVNHAPQNFTKTLEIGAGLGEHLNHEKLTPEQKENYHALELREKFAKVIRKKFPFAQTLVGDCQETLPFADGEFDRIIAIHVLEHLPNLPATIAEMYRLCNKKNGVFSIVIPCEGGMAYSFARKISAQKIFEHRYKQPYQFYIEREHLNVPAEILQELDPYFELVHKSFFPLLIPWVVCNLCIGLTLRPRN